MKLPRNRSTKSKEINERDISPTIWKTGEKSFRFANICAHNCLHFEYICLNNLYIYIWIYQLNLAGTGRSIHPLQPNCRVWAYSELVLWKNSSNCTMCSIDVIQLSPFNSIELKLDARIIGIRVHMVMPCANAHFHFEYNL